MKERSPEEKAKTLACGLGTSLVTDDECWRIMLTTYDRETLELAARRIRGRLAIIETEIARRVPT